MKPLRLLACAAALTATVLTHAVTIQTNGTIQFNGTVTMINITDYPWVDRSTMWGAVDTGGMTGTSASGFTSLSSMASFDVTKLTFSYGGLSLTSHLSPTPTVAGYEVYTGGSVPFTISYNGTLWASGTTVFLRSEVTNSNDYNATGSGQAFLTGANAGAGADAQAFFDEVMAQTGGTGLLNITIDGFAAVDNAGHFTSTGSITAVPEPATYALAFGLAALALALCARKTR